MTTRPIQKALLVGMIIAGIFANTLQGQTADALIRKLVEKGILTQAEATGLLAESTNDFNRALEPKTTMPSWVNSISFGGDFRGRYDGIYQDDSNTGPGSATEDRHRFRYRLRYGFTATLADHFETGLRLGSGEIGSAAPSLGGNPFSGNTTFNNDASKKFLFVDLAYAKWKPADLFSADLGKMNSAFWMTDMVLDPDYNPEGAQEKFNFVINERHQLNFAAGQWVIFENFNATDSNEDFGTNNAIISPNGDVYLFVGQLDWAAKWTDQFSSRLGVAGYAFLNQRDISHALESFLNQNGTSAAGSNAPDFNPIIARAEVTWVLDSAPFFRGHFPITAGFEYANNPGASDLGSAAQGYNIGLILGNAKEKRNWQLTYNYKHIGAAAVWHGLNDDDFGFNARGGTGVAGHQVIASYHAFQPLWMNVRFMLTEQINQPPEVSSEQTRIFLDLLWNF
jgi:hypothetical protein